MKKGILLLCVLSMFGCAQNNSKPPSGVPPQNTRISTPEAAWQNRQRVFDNMKEWAMEGRVGLQLRGQSWSFGMDWKQQAGGASVMDITNPLTGALMANIRETGSQVVLKAADGKSYRDTNAEKLLERQLRLKFPLNDMRYWARAVPTPDSPVEQVELDARGRPKLLQQKGWRVEYTAYKDNGPNALPTKMRLEKAAERVKAKVVTKRWQTRF